MNPSNIVVLRGRVSSEPRTRSLPSGSVLLLLEVTTAPVDDRPAATVPVVWRDPSSSSASFSADDEVVVIGHVRRRFFSAGGATQSRTEVEAERVVPAGRARDVSRLIDRAMAVLGTWSR